MSYLAKTAEIEENFEKAKRHIKCQGFTKKELSRMIRIIENTYSPLNEIGLPIISFFSGGTLTVIFSDLVLRLIQGEKIDIIISNKLVQALALAMLLSLITSLLFKIRYESLKGKSLIILYEVINEMETLAKGKRRRKRRK